MIFTNVTFSVRSRFGSKGDAARTRLVREKGQFSPTRLRRATHFLPRIYVLCGRRLQHGRPNDWPTGASPAAATAAVAPARHAHGDATDLSDGSADAADDNAHAQPDDGALYAESEAAHDVAAIYAARSYLVGRTATATASPAWHAVHGEQRPRVGTAPGTSIHATAADGLRHDSGDW